MDNEIMVGIHGDRVSVVFFDMFEMLMSVEDAVWLSQVLTEKAEILLKERIAIQKMITLASSNDGE